MARPLKGLSAKENRDRFLAKMAMVPEELRVPLGWFRVYRDAQEQQLRLSNRARHFNRSNGDEAIWAEVLPADMVDLMDAELKASIEALKLTEKQAKGKLDTLLRRTSWYREVAIPAAKGFGISKSGGARTAAKILDVFVCMARFRTIGQVMKYAGLAPENGRAPKKARGHRLPGPPAAFQSLYGLVDQWNRHDCHWKVRWAYWKAYYREQHPADQTEEVVEEGKRQQRQVYPDIRISRMAWRKVMREFIHGLWDLWRAWEDRQAGAPVSTGEAI